MKSWINEVWVTSASSTEEAKKCLVLAKSLRMSFTNRRTAIFVAASVEPRLRSLLGYIFDHVYFLEEELLGLKQPSFDDLAKISVMKLHSFEKCVYLSANSLVLRNSDNVFNFGDDGTNGKMKLVLPSGKHGDTGQLRIFGLVPNIEAYLSIRNNWATQKYCLRETMENYFLEGGHTLGNLEDIFCEELQTEGCRRTNCDVAIVTFVDDPLTFVEKDFGILENLSATLWKKLYSGIESAMLDKSSFMKKCGYAKEPIAIIGMSCRYPNSNNLEEFWRVLLAGKACTGDPPQSRLEARTAEKGGIHCGYLDTPLDEFDSKFFGISPKEVVQMDPQHRILHEVMWEALEDAAMDPLKLHSTNGSVFMGTWRMDFERISTDAGYSEFFRKYMGNSIGNGAARMSFHLGLTGPCIATESGCSASMVAVHLACQSLLNHETNMALACGANLILAPMGTNDLPNMLAPDGKCKTFDAKADGFARAEGVGVIVLKRFSDAVRDNDKIWALVRGSAMTQEGVSKSLGTPTVHSETLAMRKALEDAGVEPEQVSYLEMHGTGTPTGDPIEAKAIANAYHSKKRKHPLLVASAKTIVGHTESCSGILGIMKVALQMKHGVIPPHRNLDEIHPQINLELIPAKIPLEAEEWRRVDGQRRIAGVSSFGITGTDTHVLVEESPPENAWKFVTDFKRPWNILKISAKTEAAFDCLVEKYLERLRRMDCGEEEDTLENICYSGNVGRADFQFRSCLIGRRREEMISALEKNKLEGRKMPDVPPTICFLFPGQGCQYPEMAKDLYEQSPVFRVHFDYCAQLLHSEHNINLRQVLWPRGVDALSGPVNCHSAIFTVEYAFFKLWESWGVTPDMCLGHSLGEFAASVCAGILRVEDALKMLVSRAQAVETKCPPGRMLAIRAGKSVVLEKMRDFAGKDESEIFDFAAFNSDDQTVVAGDVRRIQEFSEYLKREGNLKCTMLQSTHAFHSKHMDKIKEDYERVLKSVKIADSSTWKCCYISGVRGSLVKCATELETSYWLDQNRHPVNFVEASNTATKLGAIIFLEVGPQPILSALQMMNTKHNDKITCLASLRKKEESWRTMMESLKVLYTSGIDIDWIGLDKLYERRKVFLPAYPFIRKRFWPEKERGSYKRIVHPLLGYRVPNATSTNIFQVGLNLAELGYLKHHVIGDNVIYPAASFVETMLAAGGMSLRRNDLTKSSGSTLKLENVVIQAPLRLAEGTITQVQTVAIDSSNEDGGLEVKIFRKAADGKDGGGEEEKDVWHPHAYGTVVPLSSEEDMALDLDIDLDKFEKTIKLCQDDNFLEDIYATLEKLGLKFGETFKSLEKVWRENADDHCLIKLKFPANQNYFLHPVIIDAMLQALLIFDRDTASLKEALQLPVRIGKFVWVAGESDVDGGDLYIHVSKNKSHLAVLLNSSGSLIAVMEDAEFTRTTLAALNSSLEQQTSDEMPTLWEQVWTGTRGTMEHRLNFDSIPELVFSKEFLQRICDSCNVLRKENLKTWQLLEKFVFYNVLKGLYDCGWKEGMGNQVCLDTLLESLGFLKKHKGIVAFYLRILEEEGFLKKKTDDDFIWSQIKALPSHAEVEEQLGSYTFKEELVQLFPSADLLRAIGENLARILKKDDGIAMQILFPDTLQDVPSVAQVYQEYFHVVQGIELGSQIVEERLRFWKDQMAGEKFVLRILEIGAGTGGYTNVWINALNKLGIDFEFHYTDISPAFFPAAEKKFEKCRGKMRFQKLNIEEDPLSQGFLPEYFDCVVASEVIHATRDIRQSLGNVRKILRNGGCFEIFEQTKVNRILSYIFGCLEGFWRFEDFDLRRDHCTMSVEHWILAFSHSGYSLTQAFQCCHDYHALICAQKRPSDNLEILKKADERDEKCWIVFKPRSSTTQLVDDLVEKLGSSCNQRVVVVQPGGDECNFREIGENTYSLKADAKRHFESLMETLSDGEVEGIVYAWPLDKKSTCQSSILQPYLNIIQTLDKLKQIHWPRCVALTSGVFQTDEDDRISYHDSTLWGFTKSMKNENRGCICRCIDVDSANLDQVFHEIWNDDNETQIRFFRGNGARLVPRLRQLKTSQNSSLDLPNGSERFQVSLPISRKISDLRFIPLRDENLFDVESENFNVEVEARAVALNFRDILTVIQPTDYFVSSEMSRLGIDVAGVVKRVGRLVTNWRPGDRVVGIFKGIFPSHRVIHEDALARIPDDITFSEAATLPLVFATVYSSLVDVANVKPEDIVLIHTASGGVGLAAINICRHLGVPLSNIICTAGSERKRNFLRESYGIVNVFNSRSTEYSHKILELTQGRGVNVVLNTLTSEGFKEATLEALAKNGHFIELSKLNIWETEQVSEIRPDVLYNEVDVLEFSSKQFKRIIQMLSLFLQKEWMHPLPYSRFDGVNLCEAMEFMRTAKHVGKVVCVLPQHSAKRGQVYTPMFSDNGTYLISGGLGGIGFQVAKWMLERGAKHLLLIGRSPPKPERQKQIERLNSEEGGAHIVTAQIDVANYAELKLVLENLRSRDLPHLKGVMHCAGSLADGAIQSVEWSTFSSPLKPKVDGTLNLHRVTSEGKMRLEHFVLFSSLSALIGPPGQSNYAAGNCFEDALAHYRHSIGLPATTVNWGTWSEIGLVANLDLPGIEGMSTAQGLAALEYALKSPHRVQTCAANFSSFHKLFEWVPQAAIYMGELNWRQKDERISGQSSLESNEFWNNFDEESTSVEERCALLTEMLAGILTKILTLEVGEVLAEEDSFGELGVDSLTYIEIRNAIQVKLGKRVVVNVGVIRESDSLKELTKTLFNLILDGDVGETKLSEIRFTPLSYEEVGEIIEEDCRLAEHIRARPAEQSICQIGDVARVLLTGATGTLGPYILRELCNLPQISTVFCLVRSQKRSKKKSIEDRLREVLAQKRLLASIPMSKVTLVEGDVALPHFGLEDDSWKQMSDACDAVFHCAAAVDHVEFLTKGKKTKVRSVNIDGVNHVLEFACAGKKVKHVFYSSSVVVCGRGRSEKGRLAEEWPKLGDFEKMTPFSYPISKFCGDMLLKEACLERGIPCKSFRFPIITGDSKTGQFTIDQNHYMLRYFYMMKTGIMPSLPFPVLILPVDICARVSITLFFNANVPPNVYNVLHPCPDSDEEFIGLASKFGRDIRMVEFGQFTQRLRGETDDSTQITLFKDLYEDDDIYMTHYNAFLGGWVDNREHFWRSEKLRKYMPECFPSLESTLEYLERDFKFAQAQGWFAKFGIEPLE